MSVLDVGTPERWRRVKDIVAEAIDAPPDTRAAILDHACGGDAALRREVDALLSAARGSDGFLETPADVERSPTPNGDGDGHGEHDPALRAALESGLAGRYVLERELGRGGMSTVYLARDARNSRHVAIKVLEPTIGIALGTQRFLAEVWLTASLTHPNILPLFDSGDAAGLLYYVAPYIQGASLRARLQHDRQLPVDDAVRIACEVADALDYAHRHGFVHRDVKPENILLADGHAVVADFGIARAIGRAARGGEASLTATGVRLGTPSYMSPEQTAGDRELDGRSDVYALGCVLYEMLAGVPPFVGATPESILRQQVLSPAPLVTRLRPELPAELARAVTRAMAKTPADRFASAAEFAAALRIGEEIDARPLTTATGRMEGSSRRDRMIRWSPWVASGALAVALGTMVALRGSSNPPAPVAASILPPPGQHFPTDFNLPFALSPDGSRLAFVTGGETAPSRMWVRRLDQLTATPLAGAEGAALPFWSPDGTAIGFFAGGQLKTITLASGAVRVLCPVLGGDGGAWSRDGVIVYAVRGRPLHRTTAAGGDCGPALPPPPHGVVQRRPVFLDDSRRVLFHGGYQSGTWIADLQTGEQRRLSDAGSPAFAPPNHVLMHACNRQPNVCVQQLDRRKLRLVGEPIVILENVISGDGGMASFGVSPTGALIARQYRIERRPHDGERVIWLDHRGVVIDSTWLSAPSILWTAAVSHDGRRIAAGGMALWLYDVRRPIGSPLVVEGRAGPQVSPVWSPDDSLLVVQRSFSPDGAPGFLVYDVRHGTGKPLSGLEGSAGEPTDWSPDGRWLLFTRIDSTARAHVWIYSFAEHSAAPLSNDAIATSDAVFSPDGRHIAYVSEETEMREVFVRPFPAGGPPIRISTGGGLAPLWASPTELYFISGDERVMRADLRAGSPLAVNAVRPFASLAARADPRRLLAWRDGDRIGVVDVIESARERALTLVTRWQALAAQHRASGGAP